MTENKITIGNATYNVRRQFDNRRTVQEAIRESIAPHVKSGMYKGSAVTMPVGQVNYTTTLY